MSPARRASRWSAAALTCLLLGTALAVPERLPAPVQQTLYAAIDRAAVFWLWVLHPRHDPAGWHGESPITLRPEPDLLACPARPA